MSSHGKLTPTYYRNNRKVNLVLEGFNLRGDEYLFTLRVGFFGHNVGFDYHFYPTSPLSDFKHRFCK